MGLDRVGEIMDIDDGLAHPGGPKPFQRMIEKRLAGDLDERLGPRRGKRTHSLAQPRRHDHRYLRHRAARARAQRQRLAISAHAACPGLNPAGNPSAQASARRSSGTCASNQDRTGASAGWARFRSR
jgi:hypothetical protein